ncbi:neuroblastoma breakpoint family member 26-like [Diceros bicornis minor]|uniref:neuroblastoma breakpoint family member 26-like n=1 Tax=Diceros bicornis minor TaxID=77932 RepID=UPI0026EBD01F|nr:neuroblastoma breakpoint family member 26-like [Diceros bicornis minor]
MELQEVEKKEVQQDSQDQRVLPSSICQEVSDCDQPYSDGKFALAEQEVCSALDVACECSHSKRDETPTDLPENQNNHEEEDGQQPVSPSVELQQVEKKEVQQEPQDQCVLSPSICQEDSDCDQPYSHGKFTFDRQEVSSTLDVACECSHAEGDEISSILPENQNDHEEEDQQEPMTPGMELQKFEKKEMLQDSQDECALPSSICQEEPDCDQPYSEGKLTLDEQEGGSALDVGSEHFHSNGDEIPTRLPDPTPSTQNLRSNSGNSPGLGPCGSGGDTGCEQQMPEQQPLQLPHPPKEEGVLREQRPAVEREEEGREGPCSLEGGDPAESAKSSSRLTEAAKTQIIR